MAVPGFSAAQRYLFRICAGEFCFVMARVFVDQALAPRPSANKHMASMSNCCAYAVRMGGHVRVWGVQRMFAFLSTMSSEGVSQQLASLQLYKATIFYMPASALPHLRAPVTF